jgi:hypothetical protein
MQAYNVKTALLPKVTLISCSNHTTFNNTIYKLLWY